jgi:DNA-binding transcriptional LysR family regulator
MATAAMLETKQLKIFKTIVEVGSFTRAGARLNLSQPAISQHIRALEEHLGVPVLLRVGKRARPTPAGEVLLHCAEQVCRMQARKPAFAAADRAAHRADDHHIIH